MNATKYIIVISLLYLAGCRKSSFDGLSGGTALTVVNAVVGSNPLVTNFSPQGGKIPDTLSYFLTATQIGYGSFAELSGYVGSVPLSLSPITDTLFTQWSGDLNIPMNTIHTLYLTGTDTLHVDTLLTTDNPPAHGSNDSSVGIRFVNLSTGSNPVTVNIEGNANGSAVNNLPYKSITAFSDYNANSTVSGYLFVFRDATTGDSLTQFYLNNQGNQFLTDPVTGASLIFKNITIALYGSPNINSNFPQNTMIIDDY